VRTPNHRAILHTQPESDDPDVDFHFVRIDDTLSGIAVLYNTNPGHIMRMNNLFSDNIYGRVWLKVPKCPDAEERLKYAWGVPSVARTHPTRRARRREGFIFMRYAHVCQMSQPHVLFTQAVAANGRGA
jgi:hypothetical protein